MRQSTKLTGSIFRYFILGIIGSCGCSQHVANNDGREIEVVTNALGNYLCDSNELVAQWPSDTKCIMVSVQDSDGAPIGLRLLGESGDTEYRALVFRRKNSQFRPAFSYVLSQDEAVSVEVATFDDMGNVLATGRSPYDQWCDGCEVGVSLSSPGSFSCTGGRRRSSDSHTELASRRAFHSATLLDNGQVLILGGITSEPMVNVITRSQPVDVPLEGTVEVYDPGAGYYYEVTVENTVDGESSLRRVFHSPLSLGSDPATGLHKLRVYGGLTSDPRTMGLALRWAPSSSDEREIHKLPFAPTMHTRDAPHVDLLYDPVNLQLTVSAVTEGELTDAHQASLAQLFVHDEVVRVGGMTVGAAPGSWSGVAEITQFSSSSGELLSELSPLSVPRIGHTATLLRRGGTSGDWLALVWGGDVRADDPDGDLRPSNQDLCPWLPDIDVDTDRDQWGDECQLDHDSDGFENQDDNCPDLPNADQIDSDGDGIGDLCDSESPGQATGGELLSAAGASPLIRSELALDALAPQTVFHSAATVEEGVVLIYGGYLTTRFGMFFATRDLAPEELPGAYFVVLGDTGQDEVFFVSIDEDAPWPRVAFHTITPLDDARDEEGSHRLLLVGGANAEAVESGVERMSSMPLARVIEVTRNGEMTFDVEIEDLDEGGLHHTRFGHQATLLADGTVLVTGGLHGSNDPETSDFMVPLWQGEVYNTASADITLQESAGVSFCSNEAIGVDPL